MEVLELKELLIEDKFCYAELSLVCSICSCVLFDSRAFAAMRMISMDRIQESMQKRLAPNGDHKKEVITKKSRVLGSFIGVLVAIVGVSVP